MTGEQMRFRIGIHVGDIIVQGDNLFGDGVNIAARLEALAEPGGICASGTVRDQIGTKLPLSFTDLGEQQVKNIAQPIKAYRITGETSPTVTPVVGSSLPLPDKPSIAVLPFVNASNDPDVEYLSDGITESLINSLSQLPNLSVKAQSSVFRYKSREVEPQTIAADLSVQAVLYGRLVQHGDDVALYLSLVDARTGNQIWGEQYNRKLIDIVSLQNEIARDVSQELRARLSGADE